MSAGFFVFWDSAATKEELIYTYDSCQIKGHLPISQDDYQPQKQIFLFHFYFEHNFTIQRSHLTLWIFLLSNSARGYSHERASLRRKTADPFSAFKLYFSVMTTIFFLENTIICNRMLVHLRCECVGGCGDALLIFPFLTEFLNYY